MKNWMGKEKIPRILAGFFLLMLLFTIISRMLDSVMTPKVQVAGAATGHLKYTFEGQGKISPMEVIYIELPEDYLVEKTVSPGTRVEALQSIVFLQMSSIEKRREALQTEIEKLEISLEQEKLRAKASAKTKEQEVAEGSLTLAWQNYEEAVQKAEEAARAYEAAMNEMNQETAQAQAKAEAKRIQAAAQNPETANQEYEEAISALDAQYDSYEQQQRAVLDAAIERQNSMHDAWAQAQNAMDIAKKNDENAEINEQNAAKISQKAQETIQVELDIKKKELFEVEELIAANGEIKTELSGTVTEMGVKPGEVTARTQRVGIGTGQYIFTGNLEQDAANMVKEGAQVNIQYPQAARSIDVQADAVYMTGTDTQGMIDSSGSQEGTQYAAQFVATLPEGEYQPGVTANYRITIETEERYPCLIPIEGLREDAKGTYCMVIQKSATILGEEETAKKVYVTWIKSDKSQAAIEETITADDRIIVGSNKEIREGDTVRVEE